MLYTALGQTLNEVSSIVDGTAGLRGLTPLSRTRTYRVIGRLDGAENDYVA